MLHPRSAVKLQILLDLRFLPPLRRLVDRKLHPPIPIRHHLRHQRRIFRADVVIVEMLVQLEPHHVAIKIHPPVHLPPTHVAHHVVDMHQPHRPRHRVLRHRFIPWKKHAAIPGPLDERMHRISVRGDRRRPHFPLLVLMNRRRLDRSPATPRRLPPRPLRVVHPQRDRLHSVPMQLHMLGDRRIRLQRRRQHEANLVLLHHIRSPVPRPRLRPAIRHQLHPKRRAVIIRRLPRVAHIKLHMVGPVQRQKILRALSLLRRLRNLRHLHLL